MMQMPHGGGGHGGEDMAATVAAHTIRLFNPRLRRHKFLKDSSAGTAALLSTELGSSVVNVGRPFSKFQNSQKSSSGP